MRAYQRRTKSADALITGAYLAGTNTRRVRLAAKSAFAGAVSKDVVSRTFDWGGLERAFGRCRADHPPHSRWHGRARAARQEGRLDLASRHARRETGRAESPTSDQEHEPRESEAARALLDDLIQRGLKTPNLVIVDGAPVLENALAALWSDVPVQQCTVHKHRNLLAHAPGWPREEL